MGLMPRPSPRRTPVLSPFLSSSLSPLPLTPSPSPTPFLLLPRALALRHLRHHRREARAPRGLKPSIKSKCTEWQRGGAGEERVQGEAQGGKGQALENRCHFRFFPFLRPVWRPSALTLTIRRISAGISSRSRMPLLVPPQRSRALRESRASSDEGFILRVLRPLT